MTILAYNALETLEVGTVTWPQIINDTTEALDEGMVRRDVIGNRPAFGTAGRLFLDTATQEIWYDTGSAWVITNPSVTPPLVVHNATVESTTSSTFIVVPLMTVTIVTPGNYIARFSTTWNMETTVILGEKSYMSIFKNAVEESLARRTSADGLAGAGGVTRNNLICEAHFPSLVNGDVIDVRFKTDDDVTTRRKVFIVERVR